MTTSSFFTRVFLFCIATSIGGCNQDTLVNTCDPQTEYKLVCDVEATEDLLTYATYMLGGHGPTGVDLVVHQGEVEKSLILNLSSFANQTPTSSYIDQDGVEIFVWHYEVPLVNSCAAVEAFCGEQLCANNSLEFCFSGSGNVSWFIIFKPDVCRLKR